MSTISSASTDTQVRAAIDDNASYEEDESLSKCRAYITAVRIWVRRLSEKKKTADAGTDIEVEISALSKELENARTWLVENGGESDSQGTQFSYADASGYRDL